MTRIIKNFFQGLIILVPMVATIYVLYLTFVKIDGILNISVPGVGFFLTVAFVTFIGFLASNFLAKRLFDYLDAYSAQFGQRFRSKPAGYSGAKRPGVVGAKRRWSFFS
jgi:uncharacterized membrane protein